MKRPLAATLAIGTELTDGQIVNRNSSWIAQRLTEFGFAMTEHRSTPDDREAILKALEEVSGRNDYLFITGGLGPTSDDMTRDVVAEFFNLPLVFDDASWEKVTARLTSRGVPVRESQRHQCEFPEGAEILVNSAGTANGFYFESGGLKVYVLPGPPNEIATIWETSIGQKLTGLVPQAERERLFLFRCMGRGESEFADLTEKIFAGLPGIRLGYRVHIPYVEIKVWIKETDLKKYKAQLRQLEEELNPYLINRDAEDLVSDVFEWLGRGNTLRVIDLATSGVFAERLLTRARELKRESPLPLTMATELRQPKLGKGDTTLFTSAASPGETVFVMAREASGAGFLVGISSFDKNHEVLLPLPPGLTTENERARKFLVEKALVLLRDTVISPVLS